MKLLFFGDIATLGVNYDCDSKKYECQSQDTGIVHLIKNFTDSHSSTISFRPNNNRAAYMNASPVTAATAPLIKVASRLSVKEDAGNSASKKEAFARSKLSFARPSNWSLLNPPIDRVIDSSLAQLWSTKEETKKW